MNASSASYVLRRLLALPTLARGLDGAARRWRWLTTCLFDPYRPERHYMRGPGAGAARRTNCSLRSTTGSPRGSIHQASSTPGRCSRSAVTCIAQANDGA
jgi:hypothetical protein